MSLNCFFTPKAKKHKLYLREMKSCKLNISYTQQNVTVSAKLISIKVEKLRRYEYSDNDVKGGRQKNGHVRKRDRGQPQSVHFFL